MHEVKMRMTIYSVHEVATRPFQANLQRGIPIYSANAVRFRFGYSVSSSEIKSSVMDGSMSSDRSPYEDYVWTYISQGSGTRMQITLAIVDEVEDLEAGKIQVPKITIIDEDFLVVIAVG